MKINLRTGVHGKVLKEYIPESEEDLQQLYEMEKQEILDANHSFGDSIEKMDGEAKKKIIEDGQKNLREHPEVLESQRKAREWDAARREEEAKKNL